MTKKSIFEYYPPQEVFEEAIKGIKRNFSLELTLIEKVRLKEYVIPIIKETENASAYDAFNPIGEVMSRFMVDYYGLPAELAMIHTTKPGPEFKVCMEGDFWELSEAFKQYLRLQQERAHLP